MTTTTKTSTTARRIEKRGHEVRSIHLLSSDDGFIVLARAMGPQPWVTWAANLNGSTFSGHYFKDLRQAEDDFLVRVARGYEMAREDILRRAQVIASRGYDFDEALEMAGRADADPLGPGGSWGLGRCDRCGESFGPDTELAEVPDPGLPEGSPVATHLTIHIGCMTDADALA